MITQFKRKDIQISITENNRTVDWTEYSVSSQSIKIANYSIDIEGIHSLVVTVYDYCYSKSFREAITVRILPNYPPAVVDTIDEVIGYQGQSIILQRNIHLDTLFYDPFDEVNFVMLGWSDDKTNSISTNMMVYLNEKYWIESSFYKSYVGECKAKILGYDTLYQPALLQYKMKILVCPQNNCLYCEGPGQSDWTKCRNGYTI